MDRLKHSLSRSEVSQLLEIDLATVDAFLESGRILCRYRRGEPRIPLDQLETFFRESLVKIYRAEAAGSVPVAEPVAVREPEPLPAEPVGSGQLAVDSPTLPEPDCQLPTVNCQPEVTIPPPPHEEELPPEQRGASRYVPLRQIDGIFGETKFSIMQMSSTGLRIRHREALMPGTEGKVSFALLKPARSIVVRARVVWTSVARQGEDRFSISGLRILEHQERIARAIDILKASHELQPERRASARRLTDGLIPVDDATDEEIALVTNAVQKFASDPVEAGRWYSRARFSLADENVRRVAPERGRDREEILGIWEYLDRQVDIPKIVGIVGWMRQAG